MIINNCFKYIIYIGCFIIFFNNKAIAKYFMVIYYNEYNYIINTYREDASLKINLITKDNINILSSFDLLTKKTTTLEKFNFFILQGLQNTYTKMLSYLEKIEKITLEDNYKIELDYIVVANKHIDRNNLNIKTPISNTILDHLKYLLENINFTINSEDIYLINNLDFLSQTGVEAFYKTSLKKKNIDSISISILEQETINCKVLTNRADKTNKKNIEFIYDDTNKANLYQQLGKECATLFNSFESGLSNIHIKFRNIINNSQLGIEFNKKTNKYFFDYLEKQSDEIKGLAIVKYFLNNEALEYEDNCNEKNNIKLKLQDSTEIIDNINILQIIINNKLTKCLAENIQKMFLNMNFPRSVNYSIILGDFISNNFIRGYYYKELINQDKNLSCYKIIVLSVPQFHMALAEASKEVIIGYDKQHNNFILPEWNPIKFDLHKIEFLKKMNQLFSEIIDDVI